MKNILKGRLKIILAIVLGSVLTQIMLQPFTQTQTIDVVVDCSRPPNFIEDSRYLNCIHQKGLKSVQLLTELFDYTQTWDGNIGQKAFEHCPVNNCFAFRSHSNQPFEESDGVIVHVPNLYYMPDRETYRRRQRQLWSFYTLESQRLSLCLRNFQITDLDDWFNLTRTVKSEFSYFSYDLKQLHKYEDYRISLLNTTNKQTAPKNSKKLAFWFVSNCKT